MYKLSFAILCSFFIGTVSFAQNSNPCGTKDHVMMDFWLGDWALTWGNGKTGQNVVDKELNGCAIIENFDGTPGIPKYFGKSMSMFDSKAGKWKQVWADSQGGWLEFTGEKVGDEIHFSRKYSKNGKPMIQRMRFYNIDFRNFDWNWESSETNGQTWTVNWKIHYERIANRSSNKSE